MNDKQTFVDSTLFNQKNCPSENELVISTLFNPSTLNDVLEQKPYNHIVKLVITNGLLDETDITFIKNHFPELQQLEIIGNAHFIDDNIMDNAFAFDGKGFANLSSVTIEHVRTVGERAFSYLPKLTTVHLPQVEAIKARAFEFAENLKYVNQGSGFDVNLLKVTYLPTRVFANTYGIVSINIPELIEIDNNAFNTCWNLAYVFMPKVERLQSRAFYRCFSLQRVVLGDKVVALENKTDGAGSWFLYAAYLTFYVKTKVTVDSYAAHPLWEEFDVALIKDMPMNNDRQFDFTFKADVETLAGKHRKGVYYQGDYKISLNLYCFSYNLESFSYSLGDNPTTAPVVNKMTVEQAIDYAKEVGFDSIDLTAYYIKGADNTTVLNMAQQKTVLDRALEIKAYAKKKGIDIGGCGIGNNFVTSKKSAYQNDIARAKFYLDMANAIDAPYMRIFAGILPYDFKRMGWDRVVDERLVPAIQEVADYGKSKGYRTVLALQNHGDILSTAKETLDVFRRINRDNVKLLDDVGYFRERAMPVGDGYDWYADIAEVLPYACNIQLKKKAGGANHPTLIDLDTIFTELRYSDYHKYERHYLSVELIWFLDDADLPSRDGNNHIPPYDQVTNYLNKVRTALERTKKEPK